MSGVREKQVPGTRCRVPGKNRFQVSGFVAWQISQFIPRFREHGRGHQELSRSSSLAEGDGSCGGELRDCDASAQERTLRPCDADSESRSLNSSQHCRGTWQVAFRRLRSPRLLRQWLSDGTGNTLSHCQKALLQYGDTIGTDFEEHGRIRPYAGRADKQAESKT